MLNRVFGILASAGAPDSPILPTLLYEEGWLLRLVLSIAAEGVDCLPFRFAPGSRWFSEPRLRSPFLARRRGDPLAETHSHADGAVGHLGLGGTTKSGLTLSACGSQFCVIEAKIASPLSSGTTRARAFDQAARNVACMAETVRCCGAPIEAWESLGFYVFAPRARIEAGVFASAMTKASIRGKIERRIAEYDAEEQAVRRAFFSEWVLPLLDRMRVECVSWESIITAIARRDVALSLEMQAFYRKALGYNGLPSEWENKADDGNTTAVSQGTGRIPPNSQHQHRS